MKKDFLFKTLALGGMVIGGMSIATAVMARIKRTRDERAAADAIVEAEVISENFSGATGKALKRRFTRTNLGLSTQRAAGDYCKVPRGKGVIAGSDGVWVSDPRAEGGMKCVPKTSTERDGDIYNPRGTKDCYAKNIYGDMVKVDCKTGERLKF